MNVYEAKISYRKKGTIVSDALDSPEAVYQYIIQSGLIDEHPEQEGFFVIPLNRKNKPKGGVIRITLGTVSSSLVPPGKFLSPVSLRARALLS